MKNFYEKYLRNFTFLCIVTSILLNLAIECLSRRSLIEGIKYLVGSPLVFIYNSLIILLTLSIVLLVKRKVFVYSLVSIIWLGFGITNGIVLSNRVTPFTGVEFKLLDSVLSVMTKYLSTFQIALIVIGIALAIIGLIIAFIKAPKSSGKINYKKNISIFLVGIASFLVITKVAIRAEIISTYFGNIAFAYQDYGFPYCFTNTIVNTGIDKPANYSEEAVKKIFNSDTYSTNLENVENAEILASKEDNIQGEEKKKPNVIMIQLESFFDPTKVKGLEFSEDPIPNFRKLSQEFSSGYISVPSVGAGTANTEFEIISGMNLEFFGPGEYPYKTILKKTTSESVNYDLKGLGYSTHAIHNNKGTFYTRQNVFKMLGFDTFTSIEYMNVEEKTPLGWAKDKYLTEPIIDAIKSTEEQDFIYTISVQGHGDYPDYEQKDHSVITLSGIDDEAQKNSFEYYVNEIHQSDQFVADLINELSKIDEETIVVMYGDHLPSLNIADEDLENGDIYQTPYVIWNNFGLPKEDLNLEAYQLTSHVLGKLGIDDGTLLKYHQMYKGTEDYLSNLKLLQYDMLYGERYIYDGVNPFSPTDLKMGVKDVVIDNVYEQDGNIYVKGKNFTDSSEIAINDSKEDTVFIDNNTLMIEDDELDDKDSITVKQVTDTNHVLSSTEKFEYNKPEEKQDI